MTYWALIVLLLAFAGTVLNLIFGTALELVFHDILLFLISLGMLFRIRHMTKKGTKEELKRQLAGNFE